MTILLLDSEVEWAKTLREILPERAQSELIGVAKDAAELATLWRQHHPDIILITYVLASRNLEELLSQILAWRPATKVVVLSLLNDSRLALRAIAAGASGYILKERLVEDLPFALEMIAGGRPYLSPGIAGVSSGASPSPHEFEMRMPPGETGVFWDKTH